MKSLNLYNILLEHQLLTEDKASKNVDKAKKYLRGKGFDNAQEVIDQIRDVIPNIRLPKDENGKDTYNYILAAARFFAERQLSSQKDMELFNKCLPYLCKKENMDKFDKSLDGYSLSSIIDMFSEEIKHDLEKDREESNSKELSKNNNYKIVEIRTPEEAAEYGKYVDWCVTHYPDMYWNYTNNGLGVFYFCLKNGFESVERERGKNCPLDEYGLSMIAVSVTSDGSPNTITCRWNHANGAGDHVMSKNELEEVLGVNFYDTFLPLDEETQREREENPPSDEYDDEQRMENYNNQRWEDGVTLIETEPSLFLLKIYDDNWDWDERLNDYNVYSDNDDTEPICWNDFDKNAEIVYKNDDKHIIGLRDQRGYIVLFWYTSDGKWDYEDELECVKECNYGILATVSRRYDLSFIKNGESVGFVREGDKEIGADENTSFVVNENLPISEEELYIETILSSNEHCLYRIEWDGDASEYIAELIIQGDVPQKGNLFTLSSDGLIHGEFDNYRLNPDENTRYGSSQLSPRRKLLNGMYLAENLEDENETQYIYNPTTKKTFPNEGFSELKAYSMELGLYLCVRKDRGSMQIFNSKGNVMHDYRIIQTIVNKGEYNDGKWNGDALMSNDPSRGIIVYFYDTNSLINAKKIFSPPKDGLIVGEKQDGSPLVIDYEKHIDLFPNAKSLKRVFIHGYPNPNNTHLLIDGTLFDVKNKKALLQNVDEAEQLGLYSSLMKIKFIDNTFNVFNVETKQVIFDHNGVNCSSSNYIIGITYPSYSLFMKMGHKDIVTPILNGEALNPKCQLVNDYIQCVSEDNDVYVRVYANNYIQAAIKSENTNWNNKPSNFAFRNFDALSSEEVAMVNNLLYANNKITEKFNNFLKRLIEY